MGKLIFKDDFLTPANVRQELASLASGLFTAIDALRTIPRDTTAAFSLLDGTAEKLKGMLLELDNFQANKDKVDKDLLSLSTKNSADTVETNS